MSGREIGQQKEADGIPCERVLNILFAVCVDGNERTEGEAVW